MARFVLDVNELAGVTVVLIEHDMDVVMDISDHINALDFGSLIADGPPQQVRSDPRVLDAYLGEDAAA
jgi:branched-chain amino acid transport system ATP-binding protein